MSDPAFHRKAATQRVQHFQQGFQANSGLAGLQFHNETHAHARRQCQLGLGKAKLVALSQDGCAQRCG